MIAGPSNVFTALFNTFLKVSSTMNALDSRFNIESCVRANDARRSNELPHREHRLAQENALREKAIAQARLEKEEAESCKDDMILDDIVPKVNEILLTKGETFIHRGYSAVFRGVAHVLPHSFKFTARGAKIIHRALALCTPTALQMAEEWKAEAEADLIEIARQEEERNNSRRAEDAEVVSSLRQEIAAIIANRTTYTRTDNQEVQLLAKSYFGLFGHLSGLVLDNTRVRGPRLVRLVHDAMIAQIQWASHWEAQMARAVKRAEAREAEFLKRRQQERPTKQQKSQKRYHKNGNSQASEQAVNVDGLAPVEEIGADAIDQSFEAALEEQATFGDASVEASSDNVEQTSETSSVEAEQEPTASASAEEHGSETPEPCFETPEPESPIEEKHDVNPDLN